MPLEPRWNAASSMAPARSTSSSRRMSETTRKTGGVASFFWSQGLASSDFLLLVGRRVNLLAPAVAVYCRVAQRLGLARLYVGQRPNQIDLAECTDCLQTPASQLYP